MSSKTDAVVKLGIVFSIALLSFSIGIFAGKKFSDNQHALAVLEPKKGGHAEREVASTAHGAPTEGRAGAMTDEEIAKLAEEFVADETVPAHGAAEASEGSHGEAGHGPASETPAKAAAPAGHGDAPTAPAKAAHGTPVAPPAHGPSAANVEPSSAAKNIASGKAPTETPAVATRKTASTEERVPTSLPKDVAQFTVGKFTVQVGAYPNQGEAEKMANDLKSKGYNAFFVPTNVKGQTYYRVSVGQFATQKEAVAYRAEFVEKSKLGAAFVQKISQ